MPITRPTGFGAAAFDDDGVVAAIRRGALPASSGAVDPLGRANGALSYELDIPAGAHRDIVVAVPFGARVPAGGLEDDAAAAFAERELAATTERWSRLMGMVTLRLPKAAERIERTLRSTQAYILVNQDGPAIQPGSRSYERSWIRDGSMTSEALLRTGHEDRVRAFLEWYAPFQYANGKVPCCVDHRGADPVPENDSHGQLIYLAHEYYRYTGDRDLLARTWPHVAKAAAYVDSLRRSRRTELYRQPDSLHLFGLMPPSISHEGYSDKAAYSYWDDAFAARGLSGAAAIAGILGKADTARIFAESAEEFRKDLAASVERAMRVHRIGFVPGAADRGDFDATSTTVTLSPGNAREVLSDSALRNTFERYWREHASRAAGRREWDAYTPYELRTVGTFVRLGQPERAHRLLDFFFGHQRPAAWNHWGEVVFRDSTHPGFVGDIPHTWVGSDFIRSALDLFAWERVGGARGDVAGDTALVIGAGIPDAWARADSGASVGGLRTPWGRLDIAVRGTATRTHVRVSGLRSLPPSGLVVHAPFPRRPRSARVNGADAELGEDGTVTVRALPAVVEFTY